MRRRRCMALARVDPDMFLTAHLRSGSRSQWSVRAALATALGELGRGAGAAAARRDARRTRTSGCIPAVLAALVSVGRRRPRAALVGTADCRRSGVVRQAAAAGLARLKARARGAALTAALRSRREGSDLRRPRGRFSRRWSSSIRDAARPLLERALEDHDWAMRVRAAALLKTVDPAADRRASHSARAADRSAGARTSRRR